MVNDLYPTDLRSILSTNGQILESQAQVLAFNLISSINFIHSANIFHRDIKPENLLITDDCQVKICDFGMATNIQRDPSIPEVNYNSDLNCFSRWYRPPEIIL